MEEAQEEVEKRSEESLKASHYKTSGGSKCCKNCRYFDPYYEVWGDDIFNSGCLKHMTKRIQESGTCDDWK